MAAGPQEDTNRGENTCDLSKLLPSTRRKSPRDLILAQNAQEWNDCSAGVGSRMSAYFILLEEVNRAHGPKDLKTKPTEGACDTPGQRTSEGVPRSPRTW